MLLTGEHDKEPRTLSRRLLLWSIVLLVLVSLIDPADQIFHAKVPFFLLIVLVWIFRLCIRRVSLGNISIWIVVILGGFTIPLFATAIGLLNGTTGPEGPNFATLKSFAILLLVPIVVNDRINLLKIIVNLCILVALATIAVAIVSVISPLAFQAIYEFTIEKQNAMIATAQSHFGVGLGSFYYKTAAVLVIPLSFYWQRTLLQMKRFSSSILLCIYGVALFLSGARANVLVAFAIVAFLFVDHVAKSITRRAIAGIAIAVIIIATVPFMAPLFDPKETSNEVKVEHYRSYLAEFADHPIYLLWGQGADTEFYTSGFQRKTNITELSYMEMLRIFGLPVTVALLTGLAYPVIPLWRKGEGERYVVVGYVAYLLVAASNPLLISSTGLLVVVAAWEHALLPSADSRRTTYAVPPPTLEISHQPGA